MNRELAQQIQACLKAQQLAMVELLRDWANLESPSGDPESQGPMFAGLTGQLQPLGFECRHIAGHNSGGQLLATATADSPQANQQLLLGHCDTVWPHGTLQRMPVESRDGRLYGPGVYDMKAGLVQAIFALRALRSLQLQPAVKPVVFVNSDEEIGSGDSSDKIQQLARQMDRVFVMEPSLGTEGRLKTSRKGVSRFVIHVQGRSAHAGLDPEKGISAVQEIAHVIQALFALNDPGRGISVNVGTVQGGTRPNVIAAEARVEVDVRVRTKADAAEITTAIEQLQPNLEGAAITVETLIARPPLEPTPANQQLWQKAVQAADSLGIPLLQGAAGGGSDGNWTSLHTATLDGMGAVGDGAHATHEHVIEDQLPQRAALLALLLLEPPLKQTI